MPLYNLTGLVQNSTSFLAFAQGVNTNLVGGWFFAMLLWGLSVVFFLSFYLGNSDVNKSLGAAGFIIFVLATGLRALNLVPNLALFISLIIAALAIAVSFKE